MIELVTHHGRIVDPAWSDVEAALSAMDNDLNNEVELQLVRGTNSICLTASGGNCGRVRVDFYNETTSQMLYLIDLTQEHTIELNLADVPMTFDDPTVAVSIEMALEAFHYFFHHFSPSPQLLWGDGSDQEEE
jgi:hypothetical protein